MRKEMGDTLIELLIAVVIIGIAVSALLSALITSLTASAEHRSLATIDTVLRSYAETIEYDVELQANSWYQDCASVTNSGATSDYVTSMGSKPVTFTAPSGYSVSITGISYWNNSTAQFDDVSSGQCQANPNDQSGYQLVTISALAPNNVSQDLSFGVT